MGADVVVNEKGEVLRYGVAHAMLVNNDTGETAEFIINPSELKYSLSVQYKKPSPIMRAPGRCISPSPKPNCWLKRRKSSFWHCLTAWRRSLPFLCSSLDAR